MALVTHRPGALRLLFLFILILVIVWLFMARCGTPWDRFGTAPTECPPDTTLLAKFEWKGGTYKFEKPTGNEAVVFVSGTAAGGAWTSTVPVNVVILKGGTETVATEYIPPVTAGTFTKDVLPPNSNGNSPDISHIEFCGSTSSASGLTVQKIVAWNGATPDTAATFSICIQGPSFPTVADCKTADFDGTTLTWLNLVPGSYQITEPSSGLDWQVSLPADAVVVAGQVAAAQLTNTHRLPEPTPTPTATETPTPEPTATSTAVPTETPTPEPTATSTAVPTETPTPGPTATSTAAPTETPTPGPTATSTAVPTETPTPEPTATATFAAATEPVVQQTATPQATGTVTPPVSASPTAATTPTPVGQSDIEGEATPAAPSSGDSPFGGGSNTWVLIAFGIGLAVVGLGGGALVAGRRRR